MDSRLAELQKAEKSPKPAKPQRLCTYHKSARERSGWKLIGIVSLPADCTNKESITTSTFTGA